MDAVEPHTAGMAKAAYAAAQWCCAFARGYTTFYPAMRPESTIRSRIAPSRFPRRGGHPVDARVPSVIEGRYGDSVGSTIARLRKEMIQRRLSHRGEPGPSAVWVSA